MLARAAPDSQHIQVQVLHAVANFKRCFVHLLKAWIASVRGRFTKCVLLAVVVFVITRMQQIVGECV